MSRPRGSAIDGELDGSRTAVLLGAGASADADLLLTSGLASAIIEKANQAKSRAYGSGKPDWVRALNAVYAGMVGHQGARGDNPLSAVNIETLISAVRLLRKRDDHEVAPFVSSWSAALSNFGSSHLPTLEGKTILDAVEKALGSHAGFSDRDITDAVARIARAAVQPDLEKPFADAEIFILRTLVELLGDHKEVTYFEPLLDLARRQCGGVDVITLNYDLTVETAASQSDVKVNRGMDSWRPGENLQFPVVDGTLNLMKLHGSLDWRVSRSRSRRQSQLTPYVLDVVPLEERDEDQSSTDLPWIVVGDREKLATDGPTLALNFAAQSALLRTSHLAVVGYSFGDGHINAMIRDWLAADKTRTMSVLDLRWPRESGYREELDFQSDLLSNYGEQQGHDGESLNPRVVPIEGRTAEKLSEVLAARPRLAPDPLAEVIVSHHESAVRLDITWHGAELSRASVSASKREDEPQGFYGQSDVALYDSTPIPSTRSPEVGERRAHDMHWEEGGTVSVYAATDTAFPLQLEVSGVSILGRLQWTGLVSLGEPATPPAGIDVPGPVQPDDQGA